jgi:hypothetical protein
MLRVLLIAFLVCIKINNTYGSTALFESFDGTTTNKLTTNNCWIFENVKPITPSTPNIHREGNHAAFVYTPELTVKAGGVKFTYTVSTNGVSGGMNNSFAVELVDNGGEIVSNIAMSEDNAIGEKQVFSGYITLSNPGTYRIRIVLNNSTKHYYYIDDIISEATYANPSCAPEPLPVTLSKFTANGTTLQWETATEVNFHKFIVQRSTDNYTFMDIGEINGHGNSSISRSYRFEDLSYTPGVKYYRLKQIDLDGAYEYSKVIAINNGTAKVRYGHFMISPSETPLSVTVYNVQGLILEKISLTKELYEVKNKGVIVIVLQTNELIYRRKIFIN